MFLCNVTSPKVTEIDILPRKFEDVNFQSVTSYKHASMDYLLEKVDPWVLKIIQQAPIQGNHKRVVIDVKFQNVLPNISTCNEGFHLDCPKHLDHPSKDEVHHLIVFGSPRTRFISQPVEIHQNDQTKVDQKMLASLPAMEIEEGKFYTFGRFDWHSGGITEVPSKRLLIRVSETDTTLPKNKPYKVKMGM